MVEVVEKHRVLTERVGKLKEELLAATPRIDTERIEFMLDVYRETAVKPTVPTIMRRAMLFHKLCSEKTIFIDDNPIVGTMTQYPYGAYPFPEEGCLWMQREEEFFLPRGKVKITPEVRKWLDKAVDVWRDSNLFSLTREVVLETYGVDIRTFSQCGVWLEAVAGGASNLIVPDYAKVLSKGLKGIIAEIDEAKAKLNVGDPGSIERLHFYRAARLALSSMIILAQRYAALAREMAQKEKDAAR